MNDPVSAELARREQVQWRWGPAIAVAVAVHALLAAVAFLGPRSGPPPLRLPSVQVRLAALPQPAAAPRGGAPVRPVAPPARAQPPQRQQLPATRPQPRPARGAAARPAATAPPAVVPPASTEPEPAAGDAAAGDAAPGATSAETGLRSAGGGLSIGGSGAPGADSAFPYEYYLNRLLASIEANWFRPESPTGTRCRVRCRIDRSGRLLEAGIEEPSAVAAFNRAALRAVYASAPFPPLPQGFGGSTLTLHLDFGQ